MSNKYYSKPKRVRAHTRRDPRINKRVSVDSYTRNQRYRNYKGIPREQALKLFNQRSNRAKAIDKSRTSKNVLEEPNEYWVENIGRSDVKDIDTKSKKEIERTIFKKESNIEHLIGKRFTDSNGVTWELTGKNDLNIPYFSKVINGKVQKKQYVVEGGENQVKVWLSEHKSKAKTSTWDFSEKEWKNISLKEKMDITDKIYDNEIIINLKNSIEQIEKRVEFHDKNVAWAYQKDLPQETKDNLNKKLKEAQKDLKTAKKQLKEKVEYLRKKFTIEYEQLRKKKQKPKPKPKSQKSTNQLKEKHDKVNEILKKEELLRIKMTSLEKEMGKTNNKTKKFAELKQKYQKLEEKQSSLIEERNKAVKEKDQLLAQLKSKETPKKQEFTNEMANYLNETIRKHKKPYMEKMKQLEERIMDIERKGRNKSDFGVVLRYPEGEQKELVEQYNKLKNRVDRINSRDYELLLQKRWKTLQDLPKLKDKEKYYIVSVEGDYANYVSHTTNKEKAIKDAEVQKIFLKKYRPDKKGKIEIIVGNDIHDVRDQLHERGREDYLITGNTYLNKKKIHGIAKVKFDYNEKGYRGKLSKEEFEELKKIPGLKVKKFTPFTKEDIEISNIEKAHSKSRKYLKHIKQEGSTWQQDRPFTKEQEWTWNSLTHYPQDWNKEFKNSVDKKEREILKRLKIQKIEDAPEDVQNAFDYYRKNSYDFIREYNRARQVAPPISVVGPAKYPTHKIPKADTIRKNASEKLKKANKTVDKITYQYVNLQPGKTAEERRQEYRENITPKLIKAKEEGKKAYSLIYDEWYNIERVNKKTITVKSKMGDYNFTIDKSFIKQIEN